VNEKVVETSTKIKIISLLFILLFLSYFIIAKNNLDIDKSEFIIEGIVFILAFNTFIISLDFKIKFISLGIGLMAFSFLNDVIDEINLALPNWLVGLQDVIFEEVFQGLAIIMITYGFYKAIEEKESFVKEMKDLAFNDYLTSLPNRRSIKEKLSLFIKEASNSSKKLGILFVDLDEFKIINDTFGHNIGDDLLKKASIRLRNVIRTKDIVARLGGDEFVIVLHDVIEYGEVECIANRIIEKFKEAFILNGIHIHTSCSIGISVFPENGGDLDTLFKNADIAMYKAKENGKNNFEIYDESMNDLSIRKLQIAEGLRIALEKEEFYLTYQPKVDILTKRITGLEALLRWNHPTFGLLYPNEFIQIAEETGIIKEIDLHVLGLVCKQLKNWINSGLEPVNIAINISAQLFNEKTFIERVESILENNEIDTSFISMEITETTAMENKDYALRILNQLKKHNIQIHLDDFGTGYSSLCYLKTFPVDVLKIDKLFIDGIVKDKKDESIITSLINMAKSLGIKVVSEGVETIQQLKFLEENKCDEYQGFLFSKPVPIEEIEARLKYSRENIKTIMSF